MSESNLSYASTVQSEISDIVDNIASAISTDLTLVPFAPLKECLLDRINIDEGVYNAEVRSTAIGRLQACIHPQRLRQNVFATTVRWPIRGNHKA